MMFFVDPLRAVSFYALLSTLFVWHSPTAVVAEEPRVAFARDVLPILSKSCFACHGPDEGVREAGLRLDVEAEAKGPRESGAAIVAQDADASQMIARLTSSDPDHVMPPPDFERRVSPEEIELLRRWIAQGATWERHWAFAPIIKPAVTIDDLVRAKLASKGLTMKPPASPQTLARRLSLDLIGLPPTPEAADALAQDPSPEAYERFVDGLLARPQFGEHWARMWLDLARYADTKGYEKDRGRTMWPYRDWVIKAFNDDMPLDRFTAEQLAGDLLPDATQDQLVATAFHRNTMSNDEGGTDDEEFRIAAVKDRIETTVQVWMGLTLKCAQCHSHKYDPIPTEDYYRFFALFNQTEDADRPDDSPKLELVSDSQKEERQRLRGEIASLKERLRAAEEEAALGPSDALGGTASDVDSAKGSANPWQGMKPESAKSTGGATLTIGERHDVTASGESPAEDTYEIVYKLAVGKYTALRLEALPVKNPAGDWVVGRSAADPNFVVSEIVVRPAEGDKAEAWKLKQARADFTQGGWPAEGAIDGDLKTGWAIGPQKDRRHVWIAEFDPPREVTEPTSVKVAITQNFGGGLTLARFRIGLSGSDPSTLKPDVDSPQTQPLRDEIAVVEKKLGDLNASIVQVPVLKELGPEKRRVSKLHHRGNFLDQRDEVRPAVLSAFHPFPASASLDRLGVARWLVSDENVLTPRVWANRVWSRLFGQGLVETEEDFGLLGSSPSHPELLDLLAADYRDGGWSLKGLLKLIVMSETYRQEAAVDPETLRSDPANQWLSRGPRYRLSGEVMRDQALAVGGLLSDKMGGPPVMPPQPDGLWRSTYNGEQWVNAEGEDRFRRGLYTYLKRTTPYPAFTTLDGGSGEVCLIRRVRTNTPLQALITLNDPVFLEAAGGLARRMLLEAPSADPADRARRGLRLAIVRPVEDHELEPLLQLHRDAAAHFKSRPELANQWIASSRGDIAAVEPAKVDPNEFAAWILVASAILNLDETLTRN
jgi:mono/diheme cytochrome c family protein